MKKTGKNLIVGDYIYVLDKKFNCIRKVQIKTMGIQSYQFENNKPTDKIQDYILTFRLYSEDKTCIIGSENFEEERGGYYNAFIYKSDAIKRVGNIIDLQIEELLKYKKKIKTEIW